MSKKVPIISRDPALRLSPSPQGEGEKREIVFCLEKATNALQPKPQPSPRYADALRSR